MKQIQFKPDRKSERIYYEIGRKKRGRHHMIRTNKYKTSYIELTILQITEAVGEANFFFVHGREYLRRSGVS